MDLSLSKLRALVMDREGWRAAVHEISKGWTWLNNGTELMGIGEVTWASASSSLKCTRTYSYHRVRSKCPRTKCYFLVSLHLFTPLWPAFPHLLKGSKAPAQPGGYVIGWGDLLRAPSTAPSTWRRPWQGHGRSICPPCILPPNGPNKLLGRNKQNLVKAHRELEFQEGQAHWFPGGCLA